MSSNPQLVAHIRKYADRGMTLPEIEDKLKRIGWKPDKITEAVESYQKQLKESTQNNKVSHLQYSGKAFSSDQKKDSSKELFDLPMSSDTTQSANTTASTTDNSPYDYSHTPKIPKQNLESNPVSNQIYHSPQSGASQIGGPLGYLVDILLGVVSVHTSLFLLLLSIVSVIIPSYLVLKYGLPFVDSVSEKTDTVIKEIYPRELAITIEDGVASTNVEEPYYLTLTTQQIEDFLGTELPRESDIQEDEIRLVTLNTNGKAEDFEEFETLAMLTDTSLVYYNDDAVNLTSLKDFEDVTITQGMILEKKKDIFAQLNVEGLGTKLVYLIPIFLLIGTFLYILSAVLVYSFIIWLINKMFKINISFGRIYAMTAVLYIIKNMISLLLGLLPDTIPLIGSVNGILQIAVIIIAFVVLQKTQKTFKS